GSHDKSLPWLQRLWPPGMRLMPSLSVASSAQCFHGWAARASVRYVLRNSASSRRFSVLKLAQTPTCCKAPASSYKPSSNEPTRVSPFLCQRNPATTQSQSRSCFTFSITRLFGSYVPEGSLAMTPSKPAPSNLRNQSEAILRSPVAGVRWMGGGADEILDSSSRRRVWNGSPR